MTYRFCVATILIALLAVPATAQQLQIQPRWTGFKDAELRSPDEVDLTFEPRAEVTWSGVLFKDQAEYYGIDQWTSVDPKNSDVPVADLLVFFYDTPWDTSMKLRVREANVIDEEATFPEPCHESPFWCGDYCVEYKKPPIHHPTFSREEEARPAVAVQRYGFAYQR